MKGRNHFLFSELRNVRLRGFKFFAHVQTDSHCQSWDLILCLFGFRAHIVFLLHHLSPPKESRKRAILKILQINAPFTNRMQAPHTQACMHSYRCCPSKRISSLSTAADESDIPFAPHGPWAPEAALGYLVCNQWCHTWENERITVHWAPAMSRMLPTWMTGSHNSTMRRTWSLCYRWESKCSGGLNNLPKVIEPHLSVSGYYANLPSPGFFKISYSNLFTQQVRKKRPKQSKWLSRGHRANSIPITLKWCSQSTELGLNIFLASITKCEINFLKGYFCL